MKIFLLLSWILIGVAGYYAYNYYQQSQSDAEKAAADLAAATQKVATLQMQLADEKKQNVALRLAASINPTPAVAATPMSASPTSPQTSGVPALPTTITTLLGRTYTGCVLSRVTPDGISFTHSNGVAKVLFSELDPTFAATFGYDPVAARRYQDEQAAVAAKSDAARIAAEGTKINPTDAILSRPPLRAAANPAPQPAISEEQRAAIQNKINSLQADITFMEGEEAKVYQAGDTDRVKSDGNSVSHGANADKIAAEKAQVTQLQQELR